MLLLSIFRMTFKYRYVISLFLEIAGLDDSQAGRL